MRPIPWTVSTRSKAAQEQGTSQNLSFLEKKKKNLKLKNLVSKFRVFKHGHTKKKNTKSNIIIISVEKYIVIDYDT